MFSVILSLWDFLIRDTDSLFNFDCALERWKWFRIEWRQVVYPWWNQDSSRGVEQPSTSDLFTKEVNPRLAKRPLKINGRLPNRG